ncbi:hypothetical protein ACWCO0_33250 [Streptomyces tubercidicus]
MPEESVAAAGEAEVLAVHFAPVPARAWISARITRNCELVQELHSSGSPDPIAQLLTAKGIRAPFADSP